MEKRSLIVGDVHGHLDRFEMLLNQEGLLAWCDFCEGYGEVSKPDCGPAFGAEEVMDCPTCDGNGEARINDDIEVVMLGDLGHFGHGGSLEQDILTWYYASKWADVILWGNHDRAVFDQYHEFNGYNGSAAASELKKITASLRAQGKLKLAHAAHGFLMTHAGLHKQFKYQKCDDDLKKDPYLFAEWINEAENPHVQAPIEQHPIVNAIGRHRGGRSPFGGILWRDWNESLYTEFPQVFGHSASWEHKVRKSPEGHAWCVDIGGKGDKPNDNCLAGIYLPDETIVRIDK